MESNTAVEAAKTDSDGWRRLEAAVGSLLEQHVAWRGRAAAAERRIQELEAALSAVSSGRLDPVGLAEQLRSYEHENRLLRDRIDRAAEVVERIQARLQFLEVGP